MMADIQIDSEVSVTDNYNETWKDRAQKASLKPQACYWDKGSEIRHVVDTTPYLARGTAGPYTVKSLTRRPRLAAGAAKGVSKSGPRYLYGIRHLQLVIKYGIGTCEEKN